MNIDLFVFKSHTTVKPDIETDARICDTCLFQLTSVIKLLLDSSSGNGESPGLNTYGFSYFSSISMISTSFPPSPIKLGLKGLNYIELTGISNIASSYTTNPRLFKFSIWRLPSLTEL